MKRKIIFLFLLFQAFFLFAQQPELARILALSKDEQQQRWGLDSLYKPADDYTKVLGHPYLTTTWLKGDLFLSDNTKLEGIVFRYNMYEDLVEVLLLGHRYNLSAHFVQKFAFRDPENLKKRIFTQQLSGRKIGKELSLDSLAYLELMFKGDSIMVLRHWTKEVVATTAKTNNGPSLINYRFQEGREKAFVVKRGVFFGCLSVEKGFCWPFQTNGLN